MLESKEFWKPGLSIEVSQNIIETGNDVLVVSNDTKKIGNKQYCYVDVDICKWSYSSVPHIFTNSISYNWWW